MVKYKTTVPPRVEDDNGTTGKGGIPFRYSLNDSKHPKEKIPNYKTATGRKMPEGTGLCLPLKRESTTSMR